MKKIPIQPLTKKLLIQILAISPSEFGRRMKVLEPELVEKFPTYNKHKNTLPPMIFIWICDQFEDRSIIIARLANHFGIEEPSDIEKFKNCYGITTEKTNNFMLNTPQCHPMETGKP